MHLTSPEVEALKRAAKKILNLCLFDRAQVSICPDEISKSWNKDCHVPDLEKEEINVAVTSSLLGLKVKRKCAESLGSTLSYSDQRLVFSRIIGHRTLTNHNSWIRRDKLDSLGKPIDIRT